MNSWHTLLWLLVAPAAAAALYGLHRLALWLEARGLLYYRYKKPTSSPASCMAALQQILEPPAKHVFQVKEEKRHPGEQAPGQAEPPRGEGEQAEASAGPNPP